MSLSFSSEVSNLLSSKGYGLVGKHSAVQICTWTKKSLENKGECYKHKFYGVDTHRCAQVSPMAAWCEENCIFCWRPMEWMKFKKPNKEEVDLPQDIISGLVKERKRLVSGIGGASSVNREKFKESFYKFPSHWAISLSGEATMYPYLPEFIKILKSHPEVKTIFLVTNGQEPEMLERLIREDALPTQLYISLSAYNQEQFKRINRSVYPDGWERLMRSFDILNSLYSKINTVIRFTLIKGFNDSNLEEYSNLIERAKPKYLEIKSYMHIGLSRNRLGAENMYDFEDLLEFSKKFLEVSPNYFLKDSEPVSRIVLLKRKE